MSPRKRLAVDIGLILGLILIAVVVNILAVRFRDEPERFANIRDHFKYGSYGSETRAGIPEPIWPVLPIVFEDILDEMQPNKPGTGYEKFGFLYEEGMDRPVGTTLRELPVPLIGLNCALCHSGTYRTSSTAEPQIVLGMPAHELDFQAYLRFLFAATADERFNADVLLPAFDDAGFELSWLEQRLYRHLVISDVKDVLREYAQDFEWFDVRPDQGPGRVDTFNPYKVFWNDKGGPNPFDMTDLTTDGSIGTSDFPSLWLQGPREGMNLHWDGNNSSVDERNRSAAIGSGASEESLEEDQLDRVTDWIEGLAPPAMPFEEIDWSAVPAGREVYDSQCANCHAFDGADVGQVVAVADVGTDPLRVEAFGEEIASYQNMLGDGFPWALSNFKVTNGYANSPLDGIWLRAPYLHNGSVPNLFYLLEPPEDRPTVFYRGYDVYDFDRVGFVSEGEDAEREGFRFDTSQRGNGNGGHLYGTDLTRAEKDALIEYLKTQ